MRVEFPYPNYREIAPFEVPEHNLTGVFEPQTRPGTDEESVLRNGFERPHGLPPLRDILRGKQRMLALIDDATRPTPIYRLLPHVLAHARAAGVTEDRIELLVAPGTHREMNESEQQEKLRDFHGRFRLHQHHWDRSEELHHFGETSDGTRITANKLLLDFDFVLGLGSVVPHRVKGLSGGAKIMYPGISGPEMMNRNQWDASLRMAETVMGTAENPMRLRMEEAARITGLHYIANLVRDREGRIVGCFTGDFTAAHRAAGRLAVEINEARMPDRADIVIIDAHPADRDFWQSAKGAYAGTMAVRAGGTLVLVAPNPEGIASDHPLVLETGYRPHKEIVHMVESGEINDIVGAAILGDIAQIIDRAHCVMVSPGVNQDEARKIGFDYAENVQQALEQAFDRHGRDASVAVLRYGGHILPRADPGVSGGA